MLGVLSPAKPASTLCCFKGCKSVFLLVMRLVARVVDDMIVAGCVMNVMTPQVRIHVESSPLPRPQITRREGEESAGAAWLR